MKHYCLFAVICWVQVTMLLAQPQWEDISPVPGHEVYQITEIITQELGLWATVCSHTGPLGCNDENFRPYFSPDFGNTWELRETGLPAELCVKTIEVNPQNPQHLLASVTGPEGTNLGPWFSSDQGLSWTTLMDRHHVVNPVFHEWSRAGWYSDGLHGWFAVFEFQGGGWDYVTSDGGVTWDSLGPTVESNRANFFAHPFWANIGLWQGDILHRTQDFGRHWESYPGAFSSFLFGSLGADPVQIFAIALVCPLFWYQVQCHTLGLSLLSA